ncbi:MAG: cystathionine beta-synthase, partial [Bacteroidota bacterium]
SFVGLLSTLLPPSSQLRFLQMKDELRPDDVVVVLFSDHGSKYFGKIFNNEWMQEQGFLEE